MVTYKVTKENEKVAGQTYYRLIRMKNGRPVQSWTGTKGEIAQMRKEAQASFEAQARADAQFCAMGRAQ